MACLRFGGALLERWRRLAWLARAGVHIGKPHGAARVAREHKQQRTRVEPVSERKPRAILPRNRRSSKRALDLGARRRVGLPGLRQELGAARWRGRHRRCLCNGRGRWRRGRHGGARSHTKSRETKEKHPHARTMATESRACNACQRGMHALKPPHSERLLMTLDVVAVGNAIIDILQPVQDGFLLQEDISKGAMTLVDEARADHLTQLFQSATVAAGGSAANTVTGVASFGGKAGYIGKVADDDLGARFIREFRAAGVQFDTLARARPPGTARCLIAVTPDGQRSMSTYLGASTLLSAEDIDAELVKSGTTLFLEGYLFDRDEAKAAFVRAAEFAGAAGRQVALTLSDVFCVERHRDSFKHLAANHIDVLFANEHEILALYETSDLAAALKAAQAACRIVAVTRSELGSVILHEGDETHVAPFPVSKVIDTTGAGDQYAAGFLFAYARGRPLAECGALASMAAAEVISHMGPRPETNLRALALKRGFRV
jgi:sugar/nucleoside kinase (ribokinase family)